MEIGFDCDKYVKLQKEEILDRVKRFNNRLYLEVGGKLFDDYHASRVLPGFKPDIKTKILAELKDDLEVIFCINAKHISERKIRGDFGITYAEETLRLIKELRALGITISAIVVTMDNGTKEVHEFEDYAKSLGESVYVHKFIDGYPDNIERIVSDEYGYGMNPFIPVTKKIVVVAAPGPCSGKMSVCMSQMYHEYRMGNSVGYAKYESFPVWNLPLDHPVNIAYEAATADLGDINVLDTYHLEAYNKIAVNYNRDVSSYPVLRDIIKKITGKVIYKSPTDMGVNKIGFAITNDEVVREAGKREVLRRYEKAKKEYAEGKEKLATLNRLKELVKEVQ